MGDIWLLILSWFWFMIYDRPSFSAKEQGRSMTPITQSPGRKFDELWAAKTRGIQYKWRPPSCSAPEGVLVFRSQPQVTNDVMVSFCFPPM
jgi:hypothetical protein